MIRSLHRRFLWNTFLWSCVFLLAVMFGTYVLLARYTDGIVKSEAFDVLRYGEQTETHSFVRRGVPSFLAEIRQTKPDTGAEELEADDEIVFLRGDVSAWTEEQIRRITDGMLKSGDRIGFLRKETLCFVVDRSSRTIRIAAVDYTGFRSYLTRVLLLGVVLYNVICGALFLLMKLAEKRLLRPAERAWANQERFVEDASHEMKTPIAVILSNAELGVSEQPEETERRLSVILNEAQRMKLLITRMLESARIENEAHKRRSIADFSLSDAVTECALLFEEPLYEQGIALSYDVEENLWVRSDETSLKQVLRILLENAGKYTPRGQRVQMRVRRRFSRAEIAVRNEGVGIDPNECEAIFERFYRAGEVRAHTEGSYGLGLSIAKTMIEMIGGSIRCESDGQTYTSFVVTVRSVRKQK